ncbi:DinB family protein [Nesterenkonia ebinurensis]|uniref:DinB family protein n=1 Tax=Nesterenkonia ebinurensis TaxID=2608252 RepID=UPI00123CD778|nr:DinB family protein [Nesterenkonia ebinurensis]
MTQAPERTHLPHSGTELELLTGFLEFHRQTLTIKCSGLTGDQLNTPLPPSSMTLAGMLKHLALVEDNWFSVVLHGNPDAEYWKDVDWGSDADWDWNSAVENSPEELFDLWERAVLRSRQLLEEALADGGLEQLAVRQMHSGGQVSLRWILIHMIEEYARHNGHADLIRESLDGTTGE